MGKLVARRTFLFLVLVTGFFAFGFQILRRWDDGLAEPRRLAGTESTAKDGSWEWHEFQFAEPCSAVSDKLSAWKEHWENGSRQFAMTDMEDRESGPRVWARDSEFRLNAPIFLAKGKNCAFAIGVHSDRSWIGRMVGAFKRMLHVS